ncbi:MULTISPECIES: N-acyl homoserine lactonase family protein [unclassified Sphingopyxis]|uniref:N-acyl homoserine lactonase family protein n=1 Tax=unclassified Sphingopyxis TaxID=2614943 RepID=UPI0028648333|nr:MULTISPECIES: N-acyl homoserine lactonase family protein [unclassified Sphingopyxis]MDR6832843.1 glyoxylase-like metal-dependent hydrolase (beta-lactamase superfamily II) [Sphingopyxis sp. BE122]MDR7228586.1 glyoxylase-like metal-dependent hydrolase (beta-lactamase superfamily II) [Sphingopyxis sp. BE259]
MIWKAIASAAAALTLAAPALAQDKPAPAAKVSLTRLDCGTVRVNRLNAFSDTQAYPGQSRDLTVGCYLIRHGDQLMLWDLGLPSALKGAAFTTSGDMSASVGRTLVEQLAELSIKPGDIDVVGISHFHFDHIAQLPDFPAAKLYIGKSDWDLLTQSPPPAFVNPAPFTHWISGGGKVEPVARDQDVFGDGSVVMLDMPGHTPGHHALLVRLAGMGPVLLTGDQAHFQENYDSNGVPTFNTNRADTLASFDRFKTLAKNLKATVILQHEPRDIGKLPAFPKAAE